MPDQLQMLASVLDMANMDIMLSNVYKLTSDNEFLLRSFYYWEAVKIF